MPNKLSIRIDTVDVGTPPVKQTISKFVIEKGDHVWFHNNASADATVEFEGASPLCIGNPPPENIITIAAGQKEMRTVCVDGGEFKYKATVTGALAEDPILVVEALIQVNPTPSEPPGKNPIVFPEDWIPLLLGVAIGLVVGFLGGRRKVSRPS